MLIEFRSSDRVLGLRALGIYDKGLEAAKKACENVYATPLELQSASESSDSTRTWIRQELSDMEPGEVREVVLPQGYALTLRTACSVYLTQLSKLAEKETDMLVAVDNTNELMSQLRSLADRLNGQTEMEGTVTISVPGSGIAPVTMTSAQLHRAAERLATH